MRHVLKSPFFADYLDLPIRQNEESLEEFLKLPLQLLVKFRNTNSLTSRIREVLKNQIAKKCRH